MQAVLGILWFLGLCISVGVIFELIGYSGVTRMFPEGNRWWHLPAQLASLLFFAVLIRFNPF